MNIYLIKDFFDGDKMEKLIIKGGNLSALGLHFITFPILKLEKNAVAKFMYRIMESMLLHKFSLKKWDVEKK
jgi:hypothetical protein